MFPFTDLAGDLTSLGTGCRRDRFRLCQPLRLEPLQREEQVIEVQKGDVLRLQAGLFGRRTGVVIVIGRCRRIR